MNKMSLKLYDRILIYGSIFAAALFGIKHEVDINDLTSRLNATEKSYEVLLGRYGELLVKANTQLEETYRGQISQIKGTRVEIDKIYREVTDLSGILRQQGGRLDQLELDSANEKKVEVPKPQRIYRNEIRIDETIFKSGGK